MPLPPPSYNCAVSFHGVFAPLPTPFNADADVDLQRLRAALARWVATDLTGFVVLGTNGEFGLLDDDECDRVIGEARAHIPSGRAMIAGATRESTRATIRAVRRAAELGADAVLVRTPSFLKAQMTGDALLQHYTAVADASPIPVLLYNFTAMTGVNLPPATVSRLSDHPNIVGIKESGSDLVQISDYVTSTPEEFSVLAGSGLTFYAALCAGASGGILALGTLLPDACMKLYTLVLAGQHNEARALQRRLLPIARLIGSAFGVPGLKAALKLVGYDIGPPRPPLAPLPETAIAALLEALTQFDEVPA